MWRIQAGIDIGQRTGQRCIVRSYKAVSANCMYSVEDRLQNAQNCIGDGTFENALCSGHCVLYNVCTLRGSVTVILKNTKKFIKMGKDHRKAQRKINVEIDILLLYKVRRCDNKINKDV